MIIKIKTNFKKIVNNIDNQAIMNIAIFFYLVLIFLKFKNHEYNEVISNSNEFLNILFQAAPVAVAAAGSVAGASSGAAAGAAGASAGATATTGAAGASAGATATTGAAGASAGTGAAGTTGAAGASSGTTAGAQAASKNIPGSPQPQATNIPNKNNIPKQGGMENSSKELQNKNTNLNAETKDKKNSNLNEETKDKKNHRLSGETEKEEEQETDLDEASSELKSNKKLPLLIGIGCIGGFFVLIFGIVIISFVLVSPITNIIEGLAKLEETASNVSEFFEKTKNAILLRGYGTNEEVLYKRIQEEYDVYLNSGIKIDLPLLASTLYYDAEVSEYDEEGLPKITEKLQKRINSVEDLASAMVGFIEYKYMCTEETDADGNVTYRKVLIEQKNVEKATNTISSCNASNVGDEIYDIKYESDIDKYMKHLKESKILEKIYGDSAKTEEQKDKIIQEIILHRDLWLLLYADLEEKRCETTGSIPYDLLIQLQSPIKGKYRISSYFGYRIHPIDKITKFHNGIDVVAEEDTNIYSAGYGVVTAVVNDNGNSGYGTYVFIEHEYNGIKYSSRYAHLRYNSITVSVGEIVTAGSKIGIMGTTGSSTGDHLHFEFLKGSERVNPVDLFTNARDFMYDCEKPSEMADCSLLSSIAVLAQENNYDFNLLRAVLEVESGGKTHSNEGLMIINFSLDTFFEDVEKINNTTITNKVKETFKIEDKKRFVKIDGNWTSFESSSDQVLRHQVVKIAASITEQAYDHIAMGLGQVMGFNYSSLGYGSSKEMFNELSNSVYAQVKAVIDFAKSSRPKFGEILQSSKSASDSRLDNICEQVRLNYNPNGPKQYAIDICQNYKSFRNDSSSTIENHINECLPSVFSINWSCPFVDKSFCNASSDITNKTNEIFSDTSLSLKEKRIIEIAKSLWLKVSYCNQTAENKPRDCESWEYSRKGIFDGWSTQRNGLDCGGFITWITNQYLNTTSTPYVLNSPGACTQNTDYSTWNSFKQNNIHSVSKDFRPGDVICATDAPRHVIMYLGYDDLNNNDVLDGNDRVYYIHSSTWDNGVIISSDNLTNMGKYSSYYRYK